MLIYRIAHKSFSGQLYAPGFSGRWNSEGKRVIYAAESIPLVFLESMLRRQGSGFNGDFNTMFIETPDTLAITTVYPGDLPDGWRNSRDYRVCQQIGDEWYDHRTTPILKVPSAVLPESSNFVLNTLHPDFPQIRLCKVTSLIPDTRTEELLKK